MTRSTCVGLCAVAMCFAALSMSGQEQLAKPTPANNAQPAERKLEPQRIEVQLNGHTFSLPEGFSIELVAGPPLVDRPISASFDEDGRLYVSDSSGTNDPSAKQLIDKPHRVVRLEDTDGDGKFDKSVVFADKLMFPEGTLWHDGSLYVAAPPSIWKLTDTDGDGVADQCEEWFKGNTLTGCANDLHGPYLGPDGFFYWCKGAFAEQTYERPVRNQREPGERGGVSPPVNSSDNNANSTQNNRGADAAPLAKTEKWTTKASHIFRARPDAPRDSETGSIKTSTIECVMTGGMDNPVDVVFTPTGERIFTTTFLVHPGGGNRDGLLHAVYGGVYGKDWNVIDSPSHPRTGDVMPVLCHLGAAAPCGLERFQSSAWGHEYQDNLFACCFNMRKVTRHVLQPHGATFKTEAEDFLISNNLDFHPTDVLEDADGSLLIVDTGGWYKLCCPTSQLWKPDVLGAIYRVRRLEVGGRKAERIADPYGRRIDWRNHTPEELAKLLIDQRTFVRKRAANMLAKHGVEGLDHVVAAIKDQIQSRRDETVPNLSNELRQDLVRLLWSLVRIDDPRARELMLKVLELPANEAPEILAIAAYDVSLWRNKEASPQLFRTLLRSTPAVRRIAAEAIGRIGAANSVGDLLGVVAEGEEDRFLAHSVTFALIEIANPIKTRKYLLPGSPESMKVALIALDQMPEGKLMPEDVTECFASSQPLLRETAAWIISRHADWGEALAGYLRERLASGELTDTEQKTLGQQLAQFAKSAVSVQELLATTARDVKLPPAVRLTALRAMRDSGAKELPKNWSASLLAVFGENDAALIELAVKTVRASPPHKDDAAAWRAPLLTLASGGRQPPDGSKPSNAPKTGTPVDSNVSGGLHPPLAVLRLDALAALPGGLAAKETDDKLFDFLLTQLAPEFPVVQRGTAAEVFSMAKLSPAQLTRLTEQFQSAGPLEVDRLLAAFEQSTDEKVGQQLVAALKMAPALTALRADAIKTRLAKYSSSVQDAAEPLYAALNVDIGKQKQKLEELLASLPPGDIRRGQVVFHSEKAACKACHALGYLGGKTGPDLTRIGQIRTERDLLESIIFPNASFVRSFEPVIVVTHAGKAFNGLIRHETAEEIVLATGPNKEERVARVDIEEIRPSSVSIMPAGLDQQLTLEQLADLVAFLKASK